MPADREPLISAMMKIHQYSMLCAPITSQEAAIEALQNGTSAMMKMRESYRQRRDFLVKRFNEIGLDCHLPGGAFYVFPDVSKFGLTSKEFATRLLMEEQVAAVPGTALVQAGKASCAAAMRLPLTRSRKPATAWSVS